MLGNARKGDPPSDDSTGSAPALQRSLASQLEAEQLAASSEAEPFSLAPYTLQLSRADQLDELHPHVCFSIHYPEDAERALATAFFGLTLAAPVPSGSVLLRSPIVAALRARERQRTCAREHAAALSGKLHRSGYLSEQAPHYRPDVRRLLTVLHPRTEPRTLVEFQLLRNSKIECNAFAGDSRGDYCALLLALGSFVNHGCAPNCIIDWDYALNEARFVALRQLDAEEEVCVGYTVCPIDSAVARAKRLRFACRCACCRQRLPPSAVLCRSGWLPPTAHCWWCGRPTTRRCGACQRAGFCSVECQRADQPVHRELCARLAALPRVRPPVAHQPPLKVCRMFAPPAEQPA